MLKSYETKIGNFAMNGSFVKSNQTETLNRWENRDRRKERA